jgi:hypothetical protein
MVTTLDGFKKILDNSKEFRDESKLVNDIRVG